MEKDKKIRYLHEQGKEPIAEFFADAINLNMSPFGFKIVFGLLGDEAGTVEPIANVRVSPQLAKVFSLLLKKQIENFEKNVGPISLPANLYKELGE